MPALAQCPLSFAAAPSYTAGSTPFSVAVGDFNADGRPDLVVANRDSNNVSILLGNANGSSAKSLPPQRWLTATAKPFYPGSRSEPSAIFT